MYAAGPVAFASVHLQAKRFFASFSADLQNFWLGYLETRITGLENSQRTTAIIAFNHLARDAVLAFRDSSLLAY
jgi:hypothetical protein